MFTKLPNVEIGGWYQYKGHRGSICQFDVARGDGAFDLEVADHAFDVVALAIDASVPTDGGLAVGTWWNGGSDAGFAERIADPDARKSRSGSTDRLNQTSSGFFTGDFFADNALTLSARVLLRFALARVRACPLAARRGFR